MIFEPFSGAGSLTVEILDSGTTGLLGFVVLLTLEMGSTEANDRVHTVGTAAGRTDQWNIPEAIVSWRHTCTPDG